MWTLALSKNKETNHEPTKIWTPIPRDKIFHILWFFLHILLQSLVVWVTNFLLPFVPAILDQKWASRNGNHDINKRKWLDWGTSSQKTFSLCSWIQVITRCNILIWSFILVFFFCFLLCWLKQIKLGAYFKFAIVLTPHNDFDGPRHRPSMKVFCRRRERKKGKLGMMLDVISNSVWKTKFIFLGSEIVTKPGINRITR